MNPDVGLLELQVETYCQHSALLVPYGGSG